MDGKWDELPPHIGLCARVRACLSAGVGKSLRSPAAAAAQSAGTVLPRDSNQTSGKRDSYIY